MTGATIWTSKDLSDEAGYASVIVADVQGVRTLMTLTSAGGVGIRASDGKLMWRYPQVANGTANITTPIFHDNKVFYTSAYGTGGALLGLTAQGGRGQSPGDLFHTGNAEPPWRRRSREWLSVRLQQFDSDVPGVCDGQDDVARP